MKKLPFLDKIKPSKGSATTNEFEQELKATSLTQDAWKRFKRHKMGMFGFIVATLYIIIALLTPILPFYPFERQILSHAHLPPSLRPAGEIALERREANITRLMQHQNRTEHSAEEAAELTALRGFVEAARLDPDHFANNVYLLGTDTLGRDMLSRIVRGGRISISIGLLGTITSFLIGIFYGATAGYLGGRIDNVMMRFVDILYGLPFMVIVIIIMSFIGGRSITILFVAIALISWLGIARLVRGQIISLKNGEFVQSARSAGAGNMRIITKHLLPNTLSIIIVFGTMSIPGFIMAESFLSYLGLGVSAPMASWGSLISDGARGMEIYPWLLVGPAVTMTLFLFAMNFLGDGLRDAFDPQAKNRT
ncbi:MAG: ABC transporter permease [Spirochaetaceae bacterium]|nr:ABC transporter permease [Spirochaetaceae bacterium]